MGYYIDQYGRTVYQPDPQPMDRLQQLQAQQMQAQQYATQMAQPMQQPQPMQSWAYVQGEAAAKSWMVANDQSVLLMDSEAPVFYIKSTDKSGMPLPLRIFDYVERRQNIAQNEPQEPNPAQIDLGDKYVTREEYNDLNSKYMEILNRLNNFPTSVSNSDDTRRTAAGTGKERNKGGNSNE